MVEIAPSEVFAIQRIVSFILVNLNEVALYEIEDEPNEKATTKAESPIEFVLCHGLYGFVGRDGVHTVSTMIVYPT